MNRFSRFFLPLLLLLLPLRAAGQQDDSFFRDLRDFFKANYFHNRFSIGAGYGYNLVLGHQHWLLHASLVPMWTVYEMNILRVEYDRTKQNYPFGWVSFAGTGRAGIYYRWGDRWSAGISGVIDQMVSHNFVRKSHPETVYKRFGSQEWVARFSLYCRF